MDLLNDKMERLLECAEDTVQEIAMVAKERELLQTQRLESLVQMHTVQERARTVLLAKYAEVVATLLMEIAAARSFSWKTIARSLKQKGFGGQLISALKSAVELEMQKTRPDRGGAIALKLKSAHVDEDYLDGFVKGFLDALRPR